MAKSDYDVRVTPSVLDRLIDEDPKAKVDAFVTRSESVRAWRKSVQRDLEILLNTRNSLSNLSPAFEHVRSSVAAYGLPDLTAINTSNHGQIESAFKEALERFEPRLTHVEVSVTPAPKEGAATRPVQLRVSAQLELDPEPEPIRFDVVRSFGTGRYEVRSAS